MGLVTCENHGSEFPLSRALIRRNDLDVVSPNLDHVGGSMFPFVVWGRCGESGEA